MPTISKNDLINACMDPRGFKDLLYPILNKEGLLKPKQYIAICVNFPENIEDEDFLASFRNHLRLVLKNNFNKLSKRKKRTPVGNELVELALKANRFFVAEDRQQLKPYVLDCIGVFYPYAKKPLVSLLVSWLSKDDFEIARRLLIKHYRVLDSKAVENILQIIGDISEDKEVNSALEKSPEYMLRLFSNMDMKKTDNKKKLLNWLAERPTYMSKINFPIEIGAEDFELLPTMRRFGFIKDVYSPLISASREGLNLGSLRAKSYSRKNAFGVLISLANNNGWVRNVKLNWIDEDQMKFLLFGASMRNNSEISSWFEKYKDLCEFRKEFQQKIQTFNQWFG